MDLNAKVSHRISDKASGFVSVYFGDDLFKTQIKDEDFDGDFNGSVENEKYNYHWGNLVAQAVLTIVSSLRFQASLQRLIPDISQE